MELIDKQKLREIEEALSKATPGPWEVTNIGEVSITKGYRFENGKHIADWIAEMCEDDVTDIDQLHANASLMSNAPEYIELLLGTVHSAQEEIESLKQERDEYRDAAEMANAGIRKAEYERDALLEILKWYADEKNHDWVVDAFDEVIQSDVMKDGGERARSFIAKIE